MKSGFIAILGRPNVGKSSLMNALIGQKASIVSPKAQTTRERVLGILTENEKQLVFVDTPGIFAPKTELDGYMEKTVNSAAEGVDAILLVFDVKKPLTQRDTSLIKKYVQTAPLYVIMNKTDTVGFEQIYPSLTQLSPLMETENKKGIKEIIPCSAKTGYNVDVIKNLLFKHAQEDSKYFEEDTYTDKPLSFIVCETIREKALWLLEDEIPHGIGVMIQNWEEKADLVSIEADIICEKDNHKQIIIGDGGQMIKKIGQSARQELETLIQKKIFLQLFVKVREDWRNRKNIIKDLGYRS